METKETSDKEEDGCIMIPPLVVKNSKPMIIGFCGKTGAGKDTALEANSLHHFFVASFAAPLRYFITEIFRIPKSYSIDPHLKNVVMMDPYTKQPKFNLDGKPASYRTLAQWLGSDVLRKHISEDFFVDLMKETISDLLKYFKDETYIKIADIRFPNEAKLIKDFGGKIIQIRRPEVSVDQTGVNLNHISETSDLTPYIDFIIVNDGSIEDLHKNVDTAMSSFFPDVIPHLLKKFEDSNKNKRAERDENDDIFDKAIQANQKAKKETYFEMEIESNTNFPPEKIDYSIQI